MNNLKINMNNLKMLGWVRDIVGKQLPGGGLESNFGLLDQCWRNSITKRYGRAFNTHLAQLYDYNFVCDNVRNNKTCKCENGLCEHIFAKTERNIDVLMAHDDLDWLGVSCNPHAIELLRENPENIDWEYLGDNPNPDIVNIIKECAQEDNWLSFVSNRNLNEIWEGVLDYYLLNHSDEDESERFWKQISSNPSAKAISIIESNLDKINWCSLSSNPSALHILEQNKSKINADKLTQNPAIYVYNYEKIAKTMAESDFFKQLMENRFHPKNYDKFEDWGFDA